MNDFLTELFGTTFATQAEVEAGLLAGYAAETDRLTALAATKAAALAEKARSRCPKCSASGYIAAFQHFKAGTCFCCGGTGIFSAA